MNENAWTGGMIERSSAAELRATCRVAPFGSWVSPVSAESCAKGRVALGDLRSAGRKLFWTETVPGSGGKTALFNMDADGTRKCPHASGQ